MGYGIKRVTKRLGTAALLPLIAFAAVIAASALSATPAIALDGEEEAFLGLINQYRAQNGLGGLSLDGQLNDASKWMSQDMCAKNYFSHTDSLGRDPFARMAAFGYSYNTWKGENLAAGTDTAQAAFDIWRSSPGHNANMLNGNFTVIGIWRARTGALYRPTRQVNRKAEVPRARLGARDGRRLRNGGDPLCPHKHAVTVVASEWTLAGL